MVIYRKVNWTRLARCTCGTAITIRVRDGSRKRIRSDWWAGRIYMGSVEGIRLIFRTRLGCARRKTTGPSVPRRPIRLRCKAQGSLILSRYSRGHSPVGSSVPSKESQHHLNRGLQRRARPKLDRPEGLALAKHFRRLFRMPRVRRAVMRVSSAASQRFGRRRRQPTDPTSITRFRNLAAVTTRSRTRRTRVRRAICRRER